MRGSTYVFRAGSTVYEVGPSALLIKTPGQTVTEPWFAAVARPGPKPVQGRLADRQPGEPFSDRVRPKNHDGHSSLPTAHRFAAQHRASAQQTTDAAASLRGDIAPLLPTFGLIGAEFLGVLAHVLDASAGELDTLAAHHASTADAARAGANAYESTDEAGAVRIGTVRR